VLEGNSLLVDGGLLNNLPGDVARDSGCGILIAVDVSDDMDFSVNCGSLPSAWTMLWRKLVSPTKAPQIPNFYEILDRSTTLSSLARRDAVKKDADLYLRPPVARFRRFDFEAIDELVEQGYEYARPIIEEWQSLRR
jgi:predicted acylesterase/phospholipase RssA